MTILEAIKTVVSGKHLTTQESISVFTDIMSGNTTDSQIAAFIVALRMKGESAEEIAGAATVMRDKATHIIPNDRNFLVDTCGTGGDGANTFNISTTAAFVVAGAGATVAKHGNRSVSSKCGSADVLESLGVNISIEPSKVKACIDNIGIGFLFAPSLHRAMKYAIGPRKEIGIRTIFNVLGPLTNPALAKNQVIGVFSPDLTETLATALKNMGSRNAFIVHGMDSLDEVSISSETKVSELSDGKVKTYMVKPEDFGISRAPLSSLEGNSAAENATTIRSVLAGKSGPCRDIVILNAGFALAAAGIANTPKEGLQAAAKSIDSGAASEKLEKLIEFTNS